MARSRAEMNGGGALWGNFFGDRLDGVDAFHNELSDYGPCREPFERGVCVASEADCMRKDKDSLMENGMCDVGTCCIPPRGVAQ